jgi:hypothetical protein
MNQPHLAFAENFARALMGGKFDEAHGMLTPEQRKRLPPSALKSEYDSMLANNPGPAKHVEVMQTLDVWPGKNRDDAGWAYVAIAGDSFSEAVSVVVARTDAGLAIRSIEWGRP